MVAVLTALLPGPVGEGGVAALHAIVAVVAAAADCCSCCCTGAAVAAKEQAGCCPPFSFCKHMGHGTVWKHCTFRSRYGSSFVAHQNLSAEVPGLNLASHTMILGLQQYRECDLLQAKTNL